MRVSFLKPPIGGIIGLEMITFVEPLDMESIAGGLQLEGHVCQIIDLRIDGLKKGFARLRSFGPDVVGLQCNFTTERFRMLRLARRVKEEMPGALVVVGGSDASRDPNWFLKPGVDVIVAGEGEEVMPALVNAHAKSADLRRVPGLVINAKSGPVLTGPASFRSDMDDLPFPARDLIREYASEYYINLRRPLALLETARGCSFKCNFCSVWKFHESVFREKSPRRVVAELAQIETPNVFITDDIFWMNATRGRELAAVLKASGIRKHYTIQTRSDIICRFPDIVEMWRDCGPMTVFLGLEKIDDEGLRSVNKKNTSANNNRAIRILQELGIDYTSNFIVDPSWEKSDFEKLKRWIDETGAYNSGFTVLTPLPGTDLWDDAKGSLLTDDWELFDIVHTVMQTRLPLDEFYREYAGLWKHAVDVRYRKVGRIRTHLALVAALASRNVTAGAIRKGMRVGNVLSDPKSFLRAHRDSEKRLAEAEILSQPIAPSPEFAAA